MKTFRLPDWAKLAILAGLLRSLLIARENLWFDEAFCYWIINPGSNFWAAIRGDDHPPLWYLIEAAVTRLLGLSELTMRLPAMLAGVGCVLLVWAIARELFGRRVGLTAGIIAALLPASVYFGQDARMYSFLAFCVLLMVYALIARRQALYVLAGIGAVYTHNVGVLFVLAIGLAYAIERRAWRALLPSLLIALAWLPWAGEALAAVGKTRASFWAPPLSIGGVLYPGLLDTMGWRLANIVQAPIAIILILLSLIAGWQVLAWRRQPKTFTLLAATVGGPLLLVFFCLTISNVWVYRALYPAALGLCVLWAYTLQSLQGEIGRNVRLLFAVALGIGLLGHYIPQHPRPDVVSWLAPIRSGWQAGDVIYYLNAVDAIQFQLYAGLPFALRPTPDNLLAVSAQSREAFGLTEIPLRATGARRAWVSFGSNPFTTRAELDYVQGLMSYPRIVISQADQTTLYLVEIGGRFDRTVTP